MQVSKEKAGNFVNDRQNLEHQSRQVEEGCIECGLCRKNCLFLQKYGLPKEIAAQNIESFRSLSTSFECSLCGLCTAVCPKDIDPAAMFFAMRLVAGSEGHGTYRQHKGLLSFERWGLSSLYSWYGLPDGCDTVFFPGCALAGTRSDRVVQIYRHLQKTIPALGMVLDCCTKPSHDLARKEYFQSMFGALREGLGRKGIRRVLVACPSCYRVWQDYGGSIKVETIYEQLARSGPARTVTDRVTLTVHDPCSTRDVRSVHRAVRSMVAAMGFPLMEMKHHGRWTLCCGEGGAACYLAPAYAGNWTKMRASEADGHPIVTYCAGCTGFLNPLAQTVHLADLFFAPEETLAGQVKVARSPMTWLHRILLKIRMKRLVRPLVSGRRDKVGEIVFRLRKIK